MREVRVLFGDETMMRRSPSLASMMILFLVPAMISGCRHMACGTYYDVLESDQDRAELEGWLDSNVFSRELSGDSVGLGMLAGPGGHVALDLARFDESVPGVIRGREVKPLGPNPSLPDGVFVGDKAFRGLIVAKTTMEDLAQATKYTFDEKFVRRRGRTMVSCYFEGD